MSVCLKETIHEIVHQGNARGSRRRYCGGLVEKMGVRVLVIPAAQMPMPAGSAVIYWH